MYTQKADLFVTFSFHWGASLTRTSPTTICNTALHSQMCSWSELNPAARGPQTCPKKIRTRWRNLKTGIIQCPDLKPEQPVWDKLVWRVSAKQPLCATHLCPSLQQRKKKLFNEYLTPAVDKELFRSDYISQNLRMHLLYNLLLSWLFKNS